MKEYHVINILEGIYEDYVRDNDKEYMERNIALTEAVKALTEIQQYRAIGTVEEFREAKERMTKKRPIKYRQYKKHAEGICPNCGCGVMDLNDIENCTSCGQAIDWSDTK